MRPLLAFVLACACAAPAPRFPAKTVALANQSGFEEAARGAGLAVEKCGDGAGMIVTTPGARDFTAEETNAFMQAHRAAPDYSFLVPGVDSSGFGGCCVDGSRQRSGGCIVVEIWEDSPAVATLPAALARAAPDARLSLGVRLMAVPGPRCPRGVECAPQPYSGGRRRPKSAGRRRAIIENGKPAHASGACSDDGECVASCGCVRYESRARFCADVFYEGLRDSFCGCVEGRCAWFR